MARKKQTEIVPQTPIDELRAFLKRVEAPRPSETDKKRLREMLAAPDSREALIRLSADLGTMARDAVLRYMCGDSFLAQEVARAEYQKKRDSLGLPSDSHLEAMLVDHAALAWLELQEMQRRRLTIMQEGAGYEQAMFWERAENGAAQRFLRACETLARVRRLMRPAVQVNIAAEGGQQVNVAGDVHMPPKGAAPPSPAGAGEQGPPAAPPPA